MTDFKRIAIDTAKELITNGAVVADIRDEQSLAMATLKGLII